MRPELILPAARGSYEYRVLRSCESPIEEILLEAMRRYLGYLPRNGVFTQRRLTVLRSQLKTGAGAFVFTQHKIASYRADFLLIGMPRYGDPRFVAMECDGRKYHTLPKQLRYDARRDAKIESEGYLVQRFSGWQINSDINGVLSKIVAILGNVGQEICEATGRYPRPGKPPEVWYTDEELTRMGL